MRGRSGGLWLPALVLTALAVIGVVVLLAVGAPVVPRNLPGFLVRDEDNTDRRSVRVTPSRTPSPSATPTPSGSPTPSGAGTVPSPTTGPTGATGSPGGPGTRPTPTGSPRPSSPPATTTRPPQPPTTSPSPKCTPGSVTVTADADTYVDQSAPTQNFGSAANLLVASRDRERNRRALVRFALPSIPSGCTLRTATLTLTAKEASGRQLVVTRAAAAWSEGSVTWGNAPGPSGSSSAAATVSGGKVGWSVTALVSAMRANGNYGFLVRDANENARGNGEQTNFSSRTGNGAPALYLRWS